MAADQRPGEPRWCWGWLVVLDADLMPRTASATDMGIPMSRSCRAVAQVPRLCCAIRQAMTAQRSARRRSDGVTRPHQPSLNDAVQPRRPVDGDAAGDEAQREVDHGVIPRSASARR